MTIKFNDEVSIILVSYKSKKKILKFLEYIPKTYKIIIIENSEDINLRNIVNESYKNVDIYLSSNLGYGTAANLGRSKINTKYFFLFNPDIEGIDEKYIKSFLENAERLNNNFSCLGPRYKNISHKTLKQSNKDLEIGEVYAISGAAMFFYTKNFDKIGGFDENIFLYFEETDYCKRAQNLNLFPYQLNSIKVSHNVGTSTDFVDEKEKKKLKNLCTWHFIWSKFYFHKKHYGKFLSLIIFFPIILRSIFKIFIFKILSNNEKLEKYMIRLDGLTNSIKGSKSFKRIE